ncbi:MAG: lysophospholipid acyltransferase family protein [Candidatus Caenarcaniphilales bacterium]|nr:lysophospholipid acyltransferase family protein [Candidatus Caenarcaniphilales bacterium]
MSTQNPYDSWHRLSHLAIIYVLLHPYYHLSYRLRIEGHGNIPQSPFLIVSNHFSYSDPTLLSLTFRRPVAYLAKQELFQEKLLGPIISYLGAVPVNREKPAPSTLKKLKQIVSEQGWSIGIFIEGTRNLTRGKITKLEAGAAFIAKITGGISVVPVGIIGGEKKGDSLTVRVGEAIPFDPNLTLDQMTLKYGRAIASLSEQKLEI